MFAILLFVVVVLLQAFFYRAEQQENVRKVVAVAPERALPAAGAAAGAAAHLRWVDPGKGVVAIPIDRAMALVVSEGGRSPWPQVQPPAVPVTGKALTAPGR